MKRSPMPPRTKPMKRSGPLSRYAKINAQNRKRRAAEWARAYDSAERVAFVKGLRCAACGSIAGSENAHIVSGGMGRKADASLVIPLCPPCHREQHAIGEHTFSARYDLDYARAAAETQAAWEAFSSQ